MLQLASILSIVLFCLSVARAYNFERRATDSPCTGSGDAPGVCIATGSCTSRGGTYISGACPKDPADIKCCTKTSCGHGGNCRWTSQCSSGNTLPDLCPGQAGFKCCLPPSGDGGTFPPPKYVTVRRCKQRSMNGAEKIVAGNPGKVRQIICIRNCPCRPSNSDHCCGLATDLMCTSAYGVSILEFKAQRENLA